jgi:hypothetical protein
MTLFASVNPIYHCESPGCLRDRHLALALVVGADGSRTHHWFCDLHMPEDGQPWRI